MQSVAIEYQNCMQNTNLENKIFPYVSVCWQTRKST